MNRREILALSGALAAASLAGCTSGADPGEDGPSGGGTPGGTTDDDPTTGDPTTTDDPAGGTTAGEPEVEETRLAELARDNAAFALDLHGHLARQGGNVFVSPYSISVALAMTYAGARGETRRQMEETLHYALGEEVHPAFADMRAVLESRETAQGVADEEEVDAFRLSLANALWGREGFGFGEDYLALLEEHYGAGLRRADFTGDPDGERERINEWVADNTEDRIEDLLPRGSIDASTVLVLTNAIYFLAGWIHQFDPADTEPGTFTALDGTESTVPTMHQELETGYADLDRAQALELPYSGDQVSMVLILPDEGEFEAVEREMDADQLFEVFDELGRAKGTVAMPRFEYRTKVQLSEALAEMGMPDAFGPSADLSGMVEGEGGGLRIDEVYHDAFVSVDEEGTEAAAATAVVVLESAPPEWGEIRFDRPFLFCIRDKPTDAVLFLGRVVDAGAAQGEA